MAYDYIVIGAGSAGCAVAARLTEDSQTRVLLLEAGPSDRKKEVAIPAAFGKLFQTSRDWNYATVPQAHLNDRILYWPRGKMIGGSSSMNAMMWVRGVREDYDGWEMSGCKGWGYDDVVPFFQKIEDTDRPGDPEQLGKDGPIPIRELRDPNPTTLLFVEACQRAGIPVNDQPNDGNNLGVSLTQVNQHRGRRASAAWGYLRPAKSRPNLYIETEALVVRLVIEDDRAIGVTYQQGRDLKTAYADAEIIVCAGAVNTPQILLLSGIGPPDELTEVGIEPQVESPMVGKNLSDHLASGVIAAASGHETLYTAEKPKYLLKFLLQGKGSLTSNVGEAHVFYKTDPELPAADMELIFAPVAYLDHGLTDQPGHGITIAAILLQPKSRGEIRLASANPEQSPLIDPRYLSEPEDMEVIRSGTIRAAELLETSPLVEIVGEPIRPEIFPKDYADWTEPIKGIVETLYHPVGTAAMGDDHTAVVDLDLRVRGVDGLRVADASVMPTLNRGHTNAPSIMIGERAADLIKSS